MELHVQKNKVTCFTRKANSVHFDCCVRDVSILSIYCIKDLGAMLNNKLPFHCHIVYIHFQALKTLGLIRNVIYNFSPLDSLIFSYKALIRSNLDLSPSYGIIIREQFLIN